MQQASLIYDVAQQVALCLRNRSASKQSADPDILSSSGREGPQGLQGKTAMQRASFRGGGRGAQPDWCGEEQSAPRSSWLLTGLLTKLPKPSNIATGCCHNAQDSC